MCPKSPWDNERTETLKHRWEDGASCSDIAGELGHGISRNAVIGKLHRLGLSEADRATPEHDTQTTPTKRKYTRRNPTKTWSTSRPVEPTPMVQSAPVDNIIPRGQRCTLMQLTNDTCRWPIGDPGTPDFFFCGGQTMTDRPYCSYHCRIAYLPVPTRRNRPHFRWPR